MNSIRVEPGEDTVRCPRCTSLVRTDTYHDCKLEPGELLEIADAAWKVRRLERDVATMRVVERTALSVVAKTRATQAVAELDDLLGEAQGQLDEALKHFAEWRQ